MDKETLDFMLAVSSTKFEAPRTLKSHKYYEDEDEDDEESYTTRFPCPWCPEEFDLVMLCCHMDDQHYGEGRPGVYYLLDLCPFFVSRVRHEGGNGYDWAHNDNSYEYDKEHKIRDLKGESNSALSIALKKELEDEHLKCLIESSSYETPVSQIMDADPLLSSFMYSIPCHDPSASVQPASTSTETNMSDIIPADNKLERKNQEPPLSDKDQEEKARKSEFVQGLLWSTIFDDNL